MTAGLLKDSGPLNDETLGFSCRHDSTSSSSGGMDRCLTSVFRLRLLRRHNHNRARNAASANAPSVQPKTIDNVFELPPPPLLLTAANALELADVVGLVEADDDNDVAEEGPEVMAGLEEADELDADVALELEVAVASEPELCDVDVAELDVVAVVGCPSTDVTSVNIDRASENIEPRKSDCALTHTTSSEVIRNRSMIVGLNTGMRGRRLDSGRLTHSNTHVVLMKQ